jgi:hypothetical protein
MYHHVDARHNCRLGDISDDKIKNKAKKKNIDENCMLCVTTGISRVELVDLADSQS